jgi:hypothetical protein
MHEKKECPSLIIIIPNIEVEDLVKEMLPFAAWPHLHLYLCSPRKKVRGIPIFFLRKNFHLQYLPLKRDISKVIISHLTMEVQKLKKKIPSICAKSRIPVRTSVRQRKSV